MRISTLSSGAYTQAALHALIGAASRHADSLSDVICITDSAHDISVAGLRFTPVLDAAVRAVAPPTGPISDTVHRRLSSWSLSPAGEWPIFDDLAVADAVARSFHRARGLDAVAAAAQQAEDHGVPTGITVLPASDLPVELHVVEQVADGTTSGRHVERWLRDPDRGTPEGFVVAGLDQATPSAGVLDAIRTSEVVVLSPMSPLLDAAGLLGLPGLREALRGTAATVVVLSPTSLPSAHPDADSASWTQAGLEPAASSVATLYADFVDVLVIDDDEPRASYPAAMRVLRAPLAAALAGDEAAAVRLREVVFG